MKKIRKKISVLCVLTIMLLLAACGAPQSGNTATSQSQQSSNTVTPIKWSLGTTDTDPETASMNAFADCTKAFCDYVNERSEGRLIIEPYYNSVLGGDVQLLNDIRDGNLEMGHVNLMAGIDSRFGFKTMAYMIEDFDMAHDLIASPDGGLFLILKDICADNNINLLSAGDGIMRGFIGNKKEIHVPGDLRSLTCRIYEDPCVNAFWEPLCNATIMSWSDCYTGLQTGTIDGMESAASICLASHFDEVTDYYTEIGWQWLGEYLVVNQDAFDALPEDLQEIVQQAAWDACEIESVKAAEYRSEAYQKLENNGVKVTLLSDDEMAQWVEYGKSTWPKVREVIGVDVYDKVMAVIDEYNQSR